MFLERKRSAKTLEEAKCTRGCSRGKVESKFDYRTVFLMEASE